MSNKYNRHQAVISRNADENREEDYWLKQFQKKLIEKDAVQPKSVDSFLFDQINSIMNNKSKYPSVEAAVQDMKERSGLSAFLENINKTSTENMSGPKTATEKNASDNNSVISKQVPVEKKLPLVIQKCPAIKSTLDNIIKTTRGNLSLPAIIDRARSIHQNDVSDSAAWEADDLVSYVSRLNLQAKKDNPAPTESTNLGSREDAAADDIDPANTDAFNGLVPAKF